MAVENSRGERIAHHRHIAGAGQFGHPYRYRGCRKLGYDYIYQEITSQAARDYEVMEEQLIRLVEKAPGIVEHQR